MKNWNEAYQKRGVIQSDVLDLIKDAFSVFKKNDAKRVLDLGFGTGRHTIFLSRNGFDVFGMDVSEEGKKITENRLRDAELKANLCISDMHDLPYEDNFFDGVVAAYVIEHNTYDGLVKTISEVKRVLRPNGIFATTLITENDYKNGKGNEIEPGTFVNPNDPIESEVPHRISSREEVDNLFSDFAIISIAEKSEPSTISPGDTSSRWNIIAKEIKAKND